MRSRRLRGNLGGNRPDVTEPTVEDDVDRELRTHLELRTEELIASGWDPGAARQEAQRLFGNVEDIRTRSEAEARARDRAVHRANRLEAFGQDMRYAVSSLRRSPGFALVAVATLALGIGANSAIFSVLNGVLLRPLPYPEPDALVWIDEAHEGPGSRPGPVPWPNFVDWREQSSSFSALATFGSNTASVVGGDRPVSVRVATVSREFWAVFGAVPLLGRLTGSDEHVEEGPSRIVVSERFWEGQAGGDASIVGRVLEVAGVPAEVVGVLPAAFDFPAGTDVWGALEAFPQSPSRTAHNGRVVGRLRPGATIESADAELDRVSLRMVQGLPDDDYDITGAIVSPLLENVAGAARRPLVLLMCAAMFVLLIAATNLASTLLARGAGRAREFAVRASLGASRARLLRQLLTESLVLSAVGATAGLVLATLLLRAIKALGAGSIPRIEQIHIDPAVLAFTFAAAIATTLLCGLIPALSWADRDLTRDLRSGTRGNSGRARGHWRVLIGAEVALTLLLLSGGGLLLRSFQRIISVDPGFDVEGLVTATAQLSSTRYSELTDYADFYARVIERLKEQPELAGVAVSAIVPLQGSFGTGGVAVDFDPEKRVGAGVYVAVSPDYFDVMGIPVLGGRPFRDSDRDPDGEHVVIVSQAFARQTWPGEDPIGRAMTGGGMDNYWDQNRWATVVGVVGDVRYGSLTRDVDPAYYFPIYQRPFRSRYQFHTIVRAAGGDPGDAAPVLRTVLSEMDPTAPLTVQTMSDRVGASLSERRFTIAILGAFAALALLLAGVGIYGVVAYQVEGRRREMGIRLALGETPTSVRASVVRGALTMVAGGMVVGVVGAVAGGRLVRSFLFGVEPSDPLTLATVVLLLVATAVGAASYPAVRATRVDPTLAMRAE